MHSESRIFAKSAAVSAILERFRVVRSNVTKMTGIARSSVATEQAIVATNEQAIVATDVHSIATNDAATNRTMEPEEFWEDLLAFIEDGRVVPIVGPELHTIVINGQELPLYCVLAERLLQKYGLQGYHASSPAPQADNQVGLRKHLELNDAVCELLRRGRRAVDLYRPINDLLRGLLGAEPTIPSALCDLARITDFRLFVTTTFDDLLARAIDATRAGFGPAPEQITYAPNLPGDRARDLPEVMPINYRAVFHLFGRASPSPFFAINDEDVLEFIYSLSLQAEKRGPPERMLAELRRCHLLLIGCNFADWLNRFFIRLANQVRLSGDRTKKEFLVGHEVAHDQSLTLFLERFSHNTRVYPNDPERFVSELLRRWRERRPQTVQGGTTETPGSAEKIAAGEVFLSYSHDDIGAARELCSGLEEIGAGVIWLDKSKLQPGDEWEGQINAALKRCDLFLPLVSPNTEAREEGYFHREWSIAEERSRAILGRRFIIPIVVDPAYTGNPRDYKLIPEGFFAFQFGHAPGGRMSDDLRKFMTEALRELRRRRAV
jgi:TIR domain-containing protein/SIR2-like protein